jgi:glycosyltransferase involved in cell wall biosynthesis
VECNSLISIIVPVYNAQKYLSNCIDSILNQTYKNIELILVDDGSTDNSKLVCDEYAENYHCIKVIHQENLGPSAARNKGIIAARGKYIQFVDADDSLEPNTTNKLLESMNSDVQLVICGFKSITIDNGNTIIHNSVPTIKGIYKINEFIKCFGELYMKSLINSPCNKLYVTEIIQNANILFMEGLDMGEDLLFNLEYIKVCTNISIINEPLYNYLKFKNNNSLTGSFQIDFFENQQMLFQQVREFLLVNNSYNEKNKYFLEVTYTNSIVSCLGNLFHGNSIFNSNSAKVQIRSIICDNTVMKNIQYFKEGNIQKQLIGYLIKNKSVNSIYWFLKSKSVLRSKMRPFFNLLKTVNNKNKVKN